jgi:hypothetical protein
MVGWKKRSALKPFSRDVGCKSRCFLWAGELWVGSDSGLINVWPCEATSGGLVHGQEDEMIAALFFARLCVSRCGLIIGNNPSQTTKALIRYFLLNKVKEVRKKFQCFLLSNVENLKENSGIRDTSC